MRITMENEVTGDMYFDGMTPEVTYLPVPGGSRMSKVQWTVIVDQSSPGTVDGFSVFGPYPEAIALGVMESISSAAMTEEDFNINAVIVAPLYHDDYKIESILAALKNNIE